MTVSVLVPIRSDGGRRDEIWQWVCARWKAHFPHYEIVLGASSDGPFNRAEAINNAWAAATGDTLIIADTDHVFDEHWVTNSVRLVESGRQVWCVPGRHNFLTEDRSNLYLRASPARFWHELPGFNNDDLEWSGDTGVSGLVVVSQDAMRAVRGFDARFVGWGPEDGAFAMAVTHAGWERVKERECVHLWHPRPDEAPPAHGANWELFWRYERAQGSADIDEIVNEVGHG